MTRINQMIFKKRISKKNKVNKAPALCSSPQRSGTCLLIFNKTPRKPNSALRKVVKVKLTNDKIVSAYVPGEGHNLNRFSDILVEGHRIRDLPGVKYGSIRGKLDLSGVSSRGQARSKYGSKIKIERPKPSEKELEGRSRKETIFRRLRKKSRRGLSTFIRNYQTKEGLTLGVQKKILSYPGKIDNLFFQFNYKRHLASVERNIEILKDIRFDLRLRPRNYYRRNPYALRRFLNNRKKFFVPSFRDFYVESMQPHLDNESIFCYDFKCCRHEKLFLKALSLFYKSKLPRFRRDYGRVQLRRSHLLGKRHSYDLHKDFWDADSYYDSSVAQYYALLRARYNASKNGIMEPEPVLETIPVKKKKLTKDRPKAVPLNSSPKQVKVARKISLRLGAFAQKFVDNIPPLNIKRSKGRASFTFSNRLRRSFRKSNGLPGKKILRKKGESHLKSVVVRKKSKKGLVSEKRSTPVKSGHFDKSKSISKIRRTLPRGRKLSGQKGLSERPGSVNRNSSARGRSPSKHGTPKKKNHKRVSKTAAERASSSKTRSVSSKVIVPQKNRPVKSPKKNTVLKRGAEDKVVFKGGKKPSSKTPSISSKSGILKKKKDKRVSQTVAERTSSLKNRSVSSKATAPQKNQSSKFPKKSTVLKREAGDKVASKGGIPKKKKDKNVSQTVVERTSSLKNRSASLKAIAPQKNRLSKSPKKNTILKRSAEGKPVSKGGKKSSSKIYPASSKSKVTRKARSRLYNKKPSQAPESQKKK